MSEFTDTNVCPSCDADLAYEVDGKRYSNIIGVQYTYDSPHHYDGVSEWMCPHCQYREGRWSGKALAEGESEPRYGGRA